MVKKILLGSVIAVGLVGCGGSGNNTGSSFVWGVNALPNQGSLTINANGAVVLNNLTYASSSGLFTAIGSGTTAPTFLTNSNNVQLASGTYNFIGGDYYTIFALGGANAQYLVVYPTDVTPPPTNDGRVITINASVLQPSVDVYATLSGSVQGAALVTSLSPFSPQTELELPVGTYDIQYKTAGSNVNTPALVDIPGVTVTAAGTATNIQLVSIADSQSGTQFPQQAMPTLSFPVVTGAALPRPAAHAIVIGHPGMTSFPK